MTHKLTYPSVEEIIAFYKDILIKLESILETNNCPKKPYILAQYNSEDGCYYYDDLYGEQYSDIYQCIEIAKSFVNYPRPNELNFTDSSLYNKALWSYRQFEREALSPLANLMYDKNIHKGKFEAITDYDLEQYYKKYQEYLSLPGEYLEYDVIVILSGILLTNNACRISKDLNDSIKIEYLTENEITKLINEPFYLNLNLDKETLVFRYKCSHKEKCSNDKYTKLIYDFVSACRLALNTNIWISKVIYASNFFSSSTTYSEHHPKIYSLSSENKASQSLYRKQDTLDNQLDYIFDVFYCALKDLKVKHSEEVDDMLAWFNKIYTDPSYENRTIYLAILLERLLVLDEHDSQRNKICFGASMLLSENTKESKEIHDFFSLFYNLRCAVVHNGLHIKKDSYATGKNKEILEKIYSHNTDIDDTKPSVFFERVYFYVRCLISKFLWGVYEFGSIEKYKKEVDGHLFDCLKQVNGGAKRNIHDRIVFKINENEREQLFSKLFRVQLPAGDYPRVIKRVGESPPQYPDPENA